MTTLADMVIRETFRGEKKSRLAFWSPRPLESVRKVMTDAHKFVLDDRMSEFLADLSQTPFMANPVRRPGVLDNLRHGSMLPFPKTWVEFNGRAFRKRLIEINPDAYDAGGRKLADPSEVPPRWGWLFEQHPLMPHCVKMTEFIDMEESGVGNVPFTCVWNCKDEPLPWPNVDLNSGELAHGIISYITPHIGVIHDQPIQKPFLIDVDHDNIKYKTHALVAEMTGLVRYAMAFLSTLNDVPTLITDVRPAKGYFARGRHHNFVEHKVVRLNVPQKVDHARLARKVLALSRKRWHEVRAHWRLHHKGEGVLCLPGTHAWGALGDDGRAYCQECAAWRTWIVLPHGRGDSSIGVDRIQYAVTHAT